MIKPTVGRVVWFYPATNQATSGFTPPNEGEPLAAIIARVVDADAGAVHLAVFDGAGVSRSEPYVKLIQEGEKVPADGRYAAWMPYQIGQAKKHDADVAQQRPALGAPSVTVKQMVDRFLGWPLPKTFSPDCGISFDGRGPDARGYDRGWPVGTNLLNAEEARAMFEHALQGSVPLAERPALGAAFPGYSAMQPHQQRVVDERCELGEKLAKLEAFSDTATFAELDPAERSRLMAQHGAMFAYSKILSERIAAFSPTAT